MAQRVAERLGVVLRGTLRMLEERVPQKNGFLAHFVDAHSGERIGTSEYSTIDTALAVCGAVVAASVFDDDAEIAGLWDGFDKPVGSYGGHECVYERAGTLFVYHFSLAFFPFQRVRDKDGRDWWANSREASLANKAWCADQAHRSQTFAGGLWGPAAGLGPNGYVVNGAMPAGHDGVNLEGDEPWYAEPRYGLNKGATALLGAAALGSTLVWDAFARHPWIARGTEKLGFTAA